MPHVICLDEPTNYLDNDTLAALTQVCLPWPYSLCLYLLCLYLLWPYPPCLCSLCLCSLCLSLSQALKNFKGAVVTISHNEAFVQEIVNEKWIVADGEITCVQVRDIKAR